MYICTVAYLEGELGIVTSHPRYVFEIEKKKEKLTIQIYTLCY